MGMHIAYCCWREMCRRCYEEDNVNYVRYGAKGIKVCKRWRGKNGFANFIADIGERPSKKYSIDRYPDNSGNYVPGNVRWATKRQQANNRSSNVLITYKGVTRSLVQWARKYKLEYMFLFHRLARGWSIEKALFQPSQKIKTYKYAGKEHSVPSLAVQLGIPYVSLNRYLNKGWTVSKIISYRGVSL